MADASERSSTLLPTEPNGVEMMAKFFRALGDPARLRGMRMRFAAPVIPGETIAIDIWREGAFRARAVGRDIMVADNGLASVTP